MHVSPLQSKQFADSQTSADIEQHKGLFSEGKCGNNFWMSTTLSTPESSFALHSEVLLRKLA